MSTRRKNTCALTSALKKIAAPPISDSSSHVLKTAWQNLRTHYNSEEIFHELTEIRQIPPAISTTLYNLIPAKITKDFENTQKIGIEVHAPLPNGRQAHIYILDPVSSSQHSKINYDLRLIVAWLRFVSTIASPKCSKNLNVYILRTTAKKRIPTKQSEPIDRIHANTAFTTSCAPNNDIVIFRQEEWLKVLMHETFHSMGLDFSSSASATNYSNDYILSLFPMIEPKTDIRLYETFCEIWATLFNLAFKLFFVDGTFKEFAVEKYEKALLKEQVFSIYQSNKVLRRNGIAFEDLIMQRHVVARTPVYKENTQAFSYHVLKSALLWDTDGFIQWCKTHLSHPIQFNPSKIKEFCLLVNQCMKSANYAAAVKTVIVRKDLCNSFIRNTLRMTSPNV
jgi:hypothetical protein